MLLSSDGKLPSDSRFSLVGNSSLHILGLRLEDEGHYVDELDEETRSAQSPAILNSKPLTQQESGIKRLIFTAVMPMVAAGLIPDDPTLQPIRRLMSLVGTLDF
ncbi:hypothetical protein E2320_012371 [Naja naja]|nr:hypothetical protein E2320_012371 [Naja naja]